MPKLKYFSDLSNLDDPKQFIVQASALLSEIETIMNGKIEFDSNLASQTVTTYFPTANADLIVNHSLNKLGVKYIVAGKTATCDIYHGLNFDTNSTIHLKSTASGVTVTLVLF